MSSLTAEQRTALFALGVAARSAKAVINASPMDATRAAWPDPGEAPEWLIAEVSATFAALDTLAKYEELYRS